MSLIDYFDEDAYLAAYPDIKQAYDGGAQGSALRHYVLHGAFENRKAPTDPRLAEFLRSQALMHMPPDRLIARVHGPGGQESFSSNGKIVAFDLDQAMQQAGINLPDNAKVLDFGCGPGRVFQWFQKINPTAEMHGCDIDPEPIEWISGKVTGEFIVNGFEPPLPYADETFDMVYSVSIFTHLPEDMQLRWLKELRRVTKPGGYLLLTTRGGHGAPQTDEGIVYTLGTGVEGLPDFYQFTYHTLSYIHREWSRFFDIRFVWKRGLNKHQDVVVCRV